MASAAASGVATEFTFTATQKGEQGNLITIKAILDPIGATGATTLLEDGNSVTVKLKNTGATGVVSATNAEVLTAINSGRLVTAALAAGITGANTGATFSGASAAYVQLGGGTSGAAGYDDLAAATGDGWTLRNIAAPVGASVGHGAVDIMEKVISAGPGVGNRLRVAADASTGAGAVARRAYDEENRRAKMGYPRSLYKIGATGANEYQV